MHAISSPSTSPQQHLNDQQRAAATQLRGALMVIAGAGSGKTRIITTRIAHLLAADDTRASSIVALTFTNKAAQEMRHRLARLCQEGGPLPFVGTFHSYCLMLLRKYYQRCNLPAFSILDSDDQQALIKSIIKKNNLSKFVAASSLTYQLSDLKNKIALSLDDVNTVTPLLHDIYREYEAEKLQSRAFDFDDLLIQTLALFQRDASFQDHFQSTIEHILIDEYQDTSIIQHELLKSMACSASTLRVKSLCAVGDEDQSIYSWRGASVANMRNFMSDFAPVTVIKVEQNYRSVSPILQTANHLIQHNVKRHPKELWSDKKAHGRIIVGGCYSAEQEAQAIIAFLKPYSASRPLHQCAVLYRTHYQSRQIEEALIRAGIPYHIVGGIRFYERKEIKDLLAYLRLVINPFDRVSFLRILNCPPRGIGQKGEELIISIWNQHPEYTFYDLLALIEQDSDLISTPRSLKHGTIQSFLNIFEGIHPESSPSEALRLIIDRSDYLSYLKSAFDEKEAETKIENVNEFFESVLLYEKEYEPGTTPGGALQSFLHEVALLQEKIEAPSGVDQVQLMTLHAAKGLEFYAVIIAGVEEQILPSSQSRQSVEATEEERRLLYVGITRAEEFLLILHAHRRHTYGQLSDQKPSPFLEELPTTTVQTIDFERIYPTEMSVIFGKWLAGEQNIAPSRAPSRFNTPPPPARRSTPAASSTTFTRSSSAPSSSWHKHQSVYHPTFGPGIIMEVDHAADGLFHLTILFKEGRKKILSSFVMKK